MPRPNRLKNPPIKTSDNELIFTSPFPSPFFRTISIKGSRKPNLGL